MKYIETEEQKLSINDESFLLAIKAFAGTGKTTVLKEYCLRNKNRKILYIAYNNITAKKARETFPENVTSKTIHSLAYSVFGFKLRNKLNRSTSLPFKPETIRKLFGFKKTQNAINLSKELKSILENFCFSTYKKIEDAVPFKKMEESRETMILFSNILWDEMTNENSKFPTTPDVYLKLYQLSEPRLYYDDILFDEAQDANPLILNIVLNQIKFNTKIRLVGDQHQSIYQFIGAKNALDSFSVDKILYLTKSFRFGENIAFAANCILKTLKKEAKTLTGNEKIIDQIGEVDKTKPFALIARTNSYLFMSAVSAYEKNLKIHFIGGFEKYNFEKILDIEKLYFRDNSKIRDSYTRTFKDFDEYKSTANYTNDKEMLYYIKVVEKYNGKLKDIISGLKTSTVKLDEADIILTTVHKSKGLEFNQVVLANDFPSFIVENKINIKAKKEDEINILYVACTRAINVLKPNKQLEMIIDYYNDNKEDLKNNVNKESDDKKVFISSIKNRF